MTDALMPWRSQPANKFHAGSGADGKHYWLTPPDLYAALDAEFHFEGPGTGRHIACFILPDPAR